MGFKSEEWRVSAHSCAYSALIATWSPCRRRPINNGTPPYEIIHLEWCAFSTVTTLDGKSKCVPSWCALWHKSLRLRCAFPLEISQLFMQYSNSLTMLNSARAPFFPIYLNKLSVGAVCSWLTDVHKKPPQKMSLAKLTKICQRQQRHSGVDF